MTKTIFTIGHSTHSIEDFIDTLRAYDIQLLVDVRTIPKSRHNPQFNSDVLKKNLRASGIGYVHLTGLGGLRRAKKDSLNQAWKNTSFRGFADYMQTEEFEDGIVKLVELGEDRKTVIMCAEAVPWRCHRSLIGDALLVRGISVLDIMSKAVVKEHVMTPWAEARGMKVLYPKKEEQQQ